MKFYGSVEHPGKRNALHLPAVVDIEEKVDGSNFSSDGTEVLHQLPVAQGS